MTQGFVRNTRVWWFWVCTGVAWGLLCVGIRLIALKAGHSVDDLVAERHALLARVQDLEREVADARRFEHLEARAGALGFVKPGPQRILIVPPENEEGLLSHLFRGNEAVAARRTDAQDEEELLRVRPREEVIVKKKPVRGESAARNRRRQRHP